MPVEASANSAQMRETDRWVLFKRNRWKQSIKQITTYARVVPVTAMPVANEPPA